MLTTPQVTDPRNVPMPRPEDLAPEGSQYHVVVADCEADPAVVDNAFLDRALGPDPLVDEIVLRTGDTDIFALMAHIEETRPLLMDKILINQSGRFYRPVIGAEATQARRQLYWEAVFLRGDSAINRDPSTIFPSVQTEGGRSIEWPSVLQVPYLAFGALDDVYEVVCAAASHCQMFTGARALEMRGVYHAAIVAACDERIARAFLRLASPEILELGEELNWREVAINFGAVTAEPRPKAQKKDHYIPGETTPGRIVFLAPGDDCETQGFFVVHELIELFCELGLFVNDDIDGVLRRNFARFSFYEDAVYIDPRDIVVPAIHDQDVGHLDRAQRFLSDGKSFFSCAPMDVDGRFRMLAVFARLFCKSFADGAMFTHVMAWSNIPVEPEVVKRTDMLLKTSRLLRDFASAHHLGLMELLGGKILYATDTDDALEQIKVASFADPRKGNSGHNGITGLFNALAGKGKKRPNSQDPCWSIYQDALETLGFALKDPPSAFREEVAKFFKANVQQLTDKVRPDQKGRIKRYEEALERVKKITGDTHWFVLAAAPVLEAIRRRVQRQEESETEVAGGGGAAVPGGLTEKQVLLCLHAIYAHLSIPGLPCVPDFRQDSLVFASTRKNVMQWMFGDQFMDAVKCMRKSAGHRAWDNETTVQGVRFGLALDDHGNPTTKGARDLRVVFKQSREQAVETQRRQALIAFQGLPAGTAHVQAVSSPFRNLHDGPSLLSMCWDDTGIETLTWTQSETHEAVQRRRFSRDRDGPIHERRWAPVDISDRVPTAAEKEALRIERAQRHAHHMRRSRPLLTEANRLTLDAEKKFMQENDIQDRSLILQRAQLFARFAVFRRNAIINDAVVKIGRLDDEKADGFWVRPFLRPQRVLRDVDRAKQHRLAVRKNRLLSGAGNGIGSVSATVHWAAVNDMDKTRGMAMIRQRNKPRGSGNRSCTTDVRTNSLVLRSPADRERPLCRCCQTPIVAGNGARLVRHSHPTNAELFEDVVQRVHKSTVPTTALCARCTTARVDIVEPGTPVQANQPATSTQGLKDGQLMTNNLIRVPPLPYQAAMLYQRLTRRAA